MNLKKYLVVIVVSLLTTSIFGQINTPRISPSASVSQTIGLTTVDINYSRPNVVLNGTDRTGSIWGQAVPYGLTPNQLAGTMYPWRAGANENTTITFSDDVKIQGKDLAAGTYSFHIDLAESGEATLIFNNAIGQWGSFSYDESLDALRVTTTMADAPQTNLLTYSFSDIDVDKSTCSLVWEKKQIPFEISVNTRDLVIAKMENQLKSGLGFTWQAYNQAASYLVTSESDYDKGLEWINKAITITGPNYALLSTQSQLLEKQGKKDEAETVGEHALSLATYRELIAHGDTKMRGGQFDEALSTYSKSQERYRAGTYTNQFDEFIMNVRLAQVYQKKEDMDQALTYAKKAVEVAPSPQFKAIAEQFVAQFSGGN